MAQRFNAGDAEGGIEGSIEEAGVLQQGEGLIEELACGKLAEVRVVCAPDAVDVEAVLDGVAAALGPRAPSTPVKLITFRPNGVRGALAGRPSPTPEQMTAWRAYALSAGLGAVLLR